MTRLLFFTAAMFLFWRLFKGAFVSYVFAALGLIAMGIVFIKSIQPKVKTK